MGAGEEGAAFGEGVDGGGLYLRMSAHAADPVVLIIDGDEEDVGAGIGGVEDGAEEQEYGAETEQLHGRLQTKAVNAI